MFYAYDLDISSHLHRSKVAAGAKM